MLSSRLSCCAIRNAICLIRKCFSVFLRPSSHSPLDLRLHYRRVLLPLCYCCYCCYCRPFFPYCSCCPCCYYSCYSRCSRCSFCPPPPPRRSSYCRSLIIDLQTLKFVSFRLAFPCKLLSECPLQGEHKRLTKVSQGIASVCHGNLVGSLRVA